MAGRPLIGVYGASVRAAAMSAVRAGFDVVAGDLFCDRDLRKLCLHAKCPFDNYPDGLAELADEFPGFPWMYTGGLENYPALIERISRTRPLWGNGQDVLAKVRDPFWLTGQFVGRVYGPPPVLPPTADLPLTGEWLRKPISSAGGVGVRPATPDDFERRAGVEYDYYLQQRLVGESFSAIFVLLNGKPKLVGLTEQLVGEEWLHAPPFGYCGSVYPYAHGDYTAKLAQSFIHTVALRSGLCGLCGIDMIGDHTARRPVEINPRYPASVEVIELATGVSVLRKHRVAFDTSIPTPSVWPFGFHHPVGKAIYYAPRRLTFPPAGPWDDDLDRPFDPWRVPGYADIPDAGAVVEKGWPVLTFFATAATPDECKTKLRHTAADLDRLFAPHFAPST